MKRRYFLQLLGLAAVPKPELPVRKYGHIDARRDHRAPYAMAFLDGVDVSGECQAADDIEGWVRLYKKTPSGGTVFDSTGRSLAMETRYGKVEIRMKRKQQGD